MLYSTEKEVIIQSYALRAIKLFLQLLVSAYLVFVIVYENGYQKESNGFGFSQAKASGTAYAIVNNTGSHGTHIEVWDVVNVVFSNENDATFITTNYWLTKNQTRGLFLDTPEQNDVINSTLTEDRANDCPCTALEPTTNGIANGTCNTNGTLCWAYAWGPIEQAPKPTNVTALQLVNTFNITVYNYVHWVDWGYSLNTVENGTKKLNYNIWNVEEVIVRAGYKYADVQDSGAAIAMIINWDCNFDHAPDKCSPSFNFLRLDNPKADQSSGFNFRYIDEYRTAPNSVPYRDLYKVYGLRLIFLTSGVGKKFDLVATIITIGSSIGMLFLANYLSDAICMWLLPTSAFYRNKKFMNVDEQKKEAKRMEWQGILSQEDLNRAWF